VCMIMYLCVVVVGCMAHVSACSPHHACHFADMAMDGGAAGPVGPASMEEPPASTIEMVRAKVGMYVAVRVVFGEENGVETSWFWVMFSDSKWQVLMDKTKPFAKSRWVALLITVMLYYLRVHILEGFYIVSYGLGIYVLHLFIGFLSPPVCLFVLRCGALPRRRLLLCVFLRLTAVCALLRG